MMKMSFTNNQTAFEFALYMILGSYFDRTDCTRTSLQEKKLLVQYKEQKLKRQYLMEEICIDYVEHILIPKLPAHIWKQKAEVRLVGNGRGRTILWFSGQDFRLRLEAEYHGGRRARISCRYQDKAGRIRCMDAPTRQGAVPAAA